MNLIDFIILVAVIVLLAEVTYLIARLPQKGLRRATGKVFVDTSVLIDGRIISIAKSGFITDTLVIPRSVIGELQFLADNADHDKRARARHGLDIVQELQSMAGITTELLQDGSKAEEGVDERLLNLAKQYDGAICTIDYNLNKVAQVEKIKVLNVNELAQTLRMAYLPGERMLIDIVQKGQDQHQGVGYLSDGTMVVVEHATDFVGQKVEIEFIRSLQTAAGKMMFARLVQNTKKQSSDSPVKQKVEQALSKIQRKTAVVEKKDSIPRSEVKPRSYRTSQKAVTQTRPTHPRTATPNKTTRQPGSSRRKTSSEREASFIDLVDKQ